MRKFCLISDTEISIEHNIGLFNAVANEINSFSSNLYVFKIIGIKCENKPNFEFLKCNNDIQVYRYKVSKNKFILACESIKLFFAIRRAVRDSDFVHVRGPSLPMFLALLIAPFYQKKKYWFKFANAWNENGRSILWDIQKKLLLKNNFIKVTVNGTWANLPSHFFPFENPCYFKSSFNQKLQIKSKLEEGINFIFIGRLESEKGIELILDFFKLPKNRNFKLLVIGDGMLSKKVISYIESSTFPDKLKYVVTASKEEIFNYLANAHFLLLPTTSSEGFPKVISEAWLKGVVPVTSNVSSIPQYVRDGENGFIWDRFSGCEGFMQTMENCFKITNDTYLEMQERGFEGIEKFSYEYFSQRILNEVFC